MENSGNVIYQGEFYKLTESRKRLIGTKSDSWKQKYLIFYQKGEKPVLEYHKKKPRNAKKSERTLTDSFELWPSYKVEKLQNARGRAFVCEITAADLHIFLSADDEKQIDILVFLLQVQIRLKENIKKEIISVLPDDSECQQKIGAMSSRCVLHASPWGLTLVLEQTRSLLAQWPLKSIRYYEASGAGNFSIEAGRVAPMGEGLFSFKTQPGEDDYMYDLVDNYIINTLDRVKPTQRGTPEEIEDYIREHDCLHSLTTITACLPHMGEIRNILKKNWNFSLPAHAESTSASGSQSHSSSPRNRSSGGQVSHSSTSTTRPTQSSSLVINLERPGESSTDSRRSSSDNYAGHAPSPDDSRITVRPPPLPSRSSNSGGVPRRSQRREHSIPRKVDVAGTKSEGGTRVVLSENISSGSTTPTRPHSNPSSITYKVNTSSSTVPGNASLAESGNTSRHTEFYNLSSPNMKVRISKSPVVTRHPNKVGRAEYFLSMPQSGVKSPVPSDEVWQLKPTTVPEDDDKEAAAYVDAVSRTSQKKYGGHHPADLAQLKLRRDLSTSDQSTISDYSSMDSPGQPRPRGYVNLQSSPSREIHHGRQRSAPETGLSSCTSWESRDSEETVSPPVRRQKQGRADKEEVSDLSTSGLDPGYTSGNHPLSAGNNSRSSSSYYQESVNSHGSDIFQSEIVREKQDNERKLSCFSGLDSVDEPVGDWLMSASCEDLSDHMRTVIYDDNNSGECVETIDPSLDEIDSAVAERSHQAVSLLSSSISTSDKPPLPFTGLKKFHDHTGSVSYSRDRSKSFGYMNIPSVAVVALQAKPQSSAPSAHLIRKMVNARAKQEVLRKSLSNPNFLNLGSKEHLFNLKVIGGSAPKLAPQHKQKSKSFGSLFPAIKKALSRESLGHSRSTTPERRNSRSTTPERRSSFGSRRHSNDADSSLKRQTSLHSYGEMTIKGIRMTERSRSFRRVRGSKSMEILSNTNDDTDMSRLSSATTVSSPAATDSDIQSSAEDPNRISAVSSISQPPTEIASTANSSSVQITLPASSQPSFQTPLQSPALKKPSEDKSLQLKKSTSNNQGFSKNVSNQNTSGNDVSKMQTQGKRKSKRPAVSEIVAKIEVNSADSKLLHHKQHRSQFTDSASESVDSRSQRISSTDKGSDVQGSRISFSPQRTSSNNARKTAKSSAIDLDQTGQTSDHKEIRLSSGSQGPELNHNITSLSNGGDSHLQSSGESKSKIVHTMPSPFQPIPFKKQQNGIRSVKAPTRLSRP